MCQCDQQYTTGYIQGEFIRCNKCDQVIRSYEKMTLDEVQQFLTEIGGSND